MTKSTSGFTIVELLVVIVVIGILASITVVAYKGIQNRAYLASAYSDLSMVANKMEIYRLDSANDRYPAPLNGALSPVLGPMNIRVSTGAYSTTAANSNFVYYQSKSGQNYAVIARVKNGPVLYIKGSDPTIREYINNTTPWPSGDASIHAAAVGLDTTGYDSTTDNYAAYVGTAGG